MAGGCVVSFVLSSGCPCALHALIRRMEGTSTAQVNFCIRCFVFMGIATPFMACSHMQNHFVFFDSD